MQNGLYKVQFQTPLGVGSGVVILHNGEIKGGDSSMYYIGKYNTVGDKITANVLADIHTYVHGIQPVFGVSKANISLIGTFENNSSEMTGSAVEAPGIRFQAILTLISGSSS